jgi:hypothetical protein
VRLDQAFAVGQNMAVVVELQRRVLLRRVGERVQRRMAHMLRGHVLVLIDHVRRGEVMAEGGLVLVEPRRHHGASVEGLGHTCTLRVHGCSIAEQSLMRLNGSAGTVANGRGG